MPRVSRVSLKGTLKSVINRLWRVCRCDFGGVLKYGSHEPNGEACIFEMYSQALDLEWTDNPETLQVWDLRPLNDMSSVGDEVRAEGLIPVMAAYMGSRQWRLEKQRRVLSRIFLGLTQLMGTLESMPEELRPPLIGADSLEKADKAYNMLRASFTDKDMHEWCQTALGGVGLAEKLMCDTKTRPQISMRVLRLGGFSVSLIDALTAGGTDDVLHANFLAVCKVWEEAAVGKKV